jgi:hypothetical protein
MEVELHRWPMTYSIGAGPSTLATSTLARSETVSVVVIVILL